MMYFIPWVVFLLFVILSVPIASWLDKRQMQAAMRRQFEEEDALDSEEGDTFEPDDQPQDDDAPVEESVGTDFSSHEVQLDGDEERTWEILKDIKSKKLVKKFPDFDVAYLKAAYPTGNSGDHASAVPSILEKGLAKCPRRSWLLGRLSAYCVWNREAQKGFDYGVSALLAAQSINDEPADLVGCINLLVPVFHATGHDDVADKLQNWNPGYDESPEMQTAITAAAQSLSSDAAATSIATAADSLRAKTL